MATAGVWLQERREELHLTRSAVERLTAEIAKQNVNGHYRIRRRRLAEIEQGKTVPDIFEADSLGRCYKIAYRAVLHAFGIKNGDVHDATANCVREGCPEENTFAFDNRERRFGLSFHSQVTFEETRLLTETAEELGIPSAVLPQADGSRYRVGVIGLSDQTMGELVPAGSLVVVDVEQRTVEMSGWESVRKRPIYFVWHDNGYSCCWCCQDADSLLLVPYPTSGQPVITLKTRRGATIIGRVIHVWSPVVPMSDLATRLG
jgi:hypothetical protein